MSRVPSYPSSLPASLHLPDWGPFLSPLPLLVFGVSLLFLTITYSLVCAENFLLFFQSYLSLSSGSVDNLGLGYQDVPIKAATPWKIGQVRARGKVASCPSYTSPGQRKTKAFLLLMACSSFRNLMKNYLVRPSHVVIRQMGRWKRRPTKQPYLTGLYFLSIIHGVRITLLITVVSTLHGFFFFSFDQWPEKTNPPGPLPGDVRAVTTYSSTQLLQTIIVQYLPPEPPNTDNK